MPTRAIQLALEELDARTMPSSTVSITTPPHTPPVIAPVIHTLQGTATGNYVGSLRNNTDTLTGTATLGSKGTFSLSGSVQNLTVFPHDPVTGQIVLSNGQGTITLNLTGPVPVAASAFPIALRYTVTGGTGAYQHLTGSGTVAVKLMPAPTAFGLPPQGRFSMTFA